MLVMAGTGAVMVNVSGLDGALDGFVTVIGPDPASWLNNCGTEAVNCVLLTKVVGNGCAPPIPRYTVAPGTKLEPITVRVNPKPAVTVAGEMLVIAGTGELMVMLKAKDDVPPGSVAVICPVPGCIRKLDVSIALTWVELTKVVTSATPLKYTVVPGRKLVPVTIKVIGPLPSITVGGETLVIVGVGGVIARLTALETAPPGLDAVICAVPG